MNDTLCAESETDTTRHVEAYERTGFYSDDVRSAITQLGNVTFSASHLLPYLPKRYFKFTVSQILWRMFKNGELTRIVESSYRLHGKPAFKTEPIYRLSRSEQPK